MTPRWYTGAVAQAIEFEKSMAKVNAILGTTGTPAWITDELARLTSVPSEPVEPDGLPGLFLRTLTPEEAADSILGGLLSGTLEERCLCAGHDHRPDVYDPDVCTMPGCRCQKLP